MALVVDALAETLISNLLGSVTSLLKGKVDLILNAKDELKKLLSKLECLQKALKEVDRKPFFSNERDKDLEGRMKDIFYDAQDIIEEYGTIIQLSKMDKGSMSSWNKVRKPWITLCSCFKEHVSSSYQLGNEIRKINEKLDEIEKNSKMMDFLNKTPKESSGEGPIDGVRDNPQETTHHISTVQPPLERADDKENVKELLFDDSIESCVLGKHGVSIVSIVGQAGIGKTTLAKMIFKEVEEQFGKRRWWVCVSRKPNRTDLLRKILKVVCKGSEREVEGVTSLSDLCTRLQIELSKGKFLLVLDDIWELSWWGGEVEDTLMGGAKESKILITSGYIEVSQGIGAEMYKLPELTFEESWSLFLNVALKEENELVSHNLKDIGERIVDKCGGLPLVVQTVGRLMRTKRMTEDAWNSIENSGIWEWSMAAASSSSSEYGDILPGLMLSYDDLPASLKSCFVYCCIYPKDYEIKRDLLVMQWVAHGLIEEKKGIDVEVTANQRIDDLIDKCMIEETEEGDVKLRDTLHDLASYIGRKEYSHASPTEHTRHLSLLDLDDAEMPTHNDSFAKLRTLFCASLPLEHFTNIKWLRVLSLEESEMDELPNSIEYLSLLKYLNLSNSHVKRLPSSIDRLWNLQTLDLSDSKIEEVPEEIGKLCNLRYLGLEGTEELKFVAKGLGKLTNLRTLKRFLLCNDKEDRRGCNINELKDLNNLTGKFSIEGLGEARKEINLGKAQLLKEKHLLTGLKFDFEEQHDDKVADASEQSRMLEALEPPHCLKSLKIRHYKGEMPTWYLKTDYTKLRTLKLENCPLFEKLISITSLEKLALNKCPAVCEIASMPSLKFLTIGSCDGLNTIGHDMPALESLEVDGCGRLEQLPTHLPSLEVLTVQDLPNWEGWPAIGSGETTISMPCLKEANLENCPKMQTQGLLYALSKQGHDYEPQLEELKVWDCPSASLGWKLLKQFPNLTQLILDREALESTLPSPLPSEVSTFLPFLEHLSLRDANVNELKWGRVPEWVWGLSQLDSLDLQGFTEEISLGGHWQCLQELVFLELCDFPNLKSLVNINNTISLQNDAVSTTSPTDAQEQLACLLNLEGLVVTRCPALDLPQKLRDSLGDRLCIETERD